MTTNPFQYLRKLAGISQLGMAKLTGMSRSTIVYIETGQYPHLSDYMITTLYTQCKDRGVDPHLALEDKYGVANIEEAYKQWCEDEREVEGYKFRTAINVEDIKRHSEIYRISPFAAYVEYVAGSKQKFCKMLKVSDAAVFRYSKGEAKTMPQTIEDALRQVGCPYVDDLKEMQEEWMADFL